MKTELDGRPPESKGMVMCLPRQSEINDMCGVEGPRLRSLAILSSIPEEFWNGCLYGVGRERANVSTD